MKLSFQDFNSNPILYILFLPLVAMISLFLLLNSAYVREIKNRDAQIIRLERKTDYTDSINHELYRLLGSKQIIDSLKISR